MNVVVGSLTGTQLLQGLAIYNSLTKDLGGSDATSAIISEYGLTLTVKLKIKNAAKLTTVLMNNLSPFMNQV